ncbi:pyridoxamine 5'-phosphate oxidase family protein [Halovenus sp. WSH3]|uniref:Pyridoxamine 5'-phosphate oxidase family protein n=1 Tax=Halovenus carboxidivorans TaxID=2692199 RepID=A0A6B0TH62_9EURY|nr:pyridoxamine 5'-phosphate oxidase family protein [Halovenus carboxidivorans]MXR52539.1 pyridoxamine 5'-phosphate oxidase family protein [Halovenus carboxidivorans]
MTVSELEAYGMQWMDEESVDDCLSAQSTGVLGLPDEQAPYLLPLSYAFDGGDNLYFTYVLGESSRKGELTAQADLARFLVYEASSQFRWQSVLLTGRLDRVDEDQWSEIRHLLADAWQPNTLQTAATSGGVEVYEFEIRDRSGIEQDGLAPGFRENVDP